MNWIVLWLSILTIAVGVLLYESRAYFKFKWYCLYFKQLAWPRLCRAVSACSSEGRKKEAEVQEFLAPWRAIELRQKRDAAALLARKQGLEKVLAGHIEKVLANHIRGKSPDVEQKKPRVRKKAAPSPPKT